MKAVNLIPSDHRGIGSTSPRALLTPAYGVIGALVLAIALVTVYVLSSNTVSDRQATVANLQAQVVQEQALAARLGDYAQFVKLAQAREQTVQQIASTRFNWHDALADLAKVVPANTSLQSLLGTVAPGASVNGPGGSAGGGGASTASLRSTTPVPAFEIRGCTKTQDDVAALISRLRVMPGVTRVTLADSVKSGGSAGASVGTPTAGVSGCGNNTPSFDLVIFFSPLPQLGATTGSTTQSVSTTAPTTSTTSTTTAATTTASSTAIATSSTK
jgi:Tfp pilus assembly protein PilN